MTTRHEEPFLEYLLAIDENLNSSQAIHDLETNNKKPLGAREQKTLDESLLRELVFLRPEESDGKVRLLLQSGANPNACNREYCALSAAGGIGNIKVADALLEAGADAHWLSPEGGSIFSSMQQYNGEMVEFLLDRGVDPWAGSIEQNLLACFASKETDLLHYSSESHKKTWAGLLLKVIKMNPGKTTSIMSSENFKGFAELLQMASIIRKDELSNILSSVNSGVPPYSHLYNTLWDNILSFDDVKALQYCVSRGWVPSFQPSEPVEASVGWAWRSLIGSFLDGTSPKCFSWLMRSPDVARQFVEASRLHPAETIFRLTNPYASGKTFYESKWDALRSIGVDFSGKSHNGETIAHLLLRTAGSPTKAVPAIRWLVRIGLAWQFMTVNGDGNTPAGSILVSRRSNGISKYSIECSVRAIVASEERRMLVSAAKNTAEETSVGTPKRKPVARRM